MEINNEVNIRRVLMVFRGLLIIFIVLGHRLSFSLQLDRSISWITYGIIPSFFISSGFFYKPANTMKDVKRVAKMKFKQIMIPYFIVIFSIDLPFIVKGFIENRDFIEIVTRSVALLYGGKLLVGLSTAAWFMPVFYFTRIGLDTLFCFFKGKKVLIPIITLFFLAVFYGHLNLSRILTLNMPMCIDSIIITIPYMYAGYILKKYLKSYLENGKLISIAIMAYLAIFIYYYITIQTYIFDIRSNLYSNPVFMLITPICMFLLLTKVAMYASKNKILKKILLKISKHSISIMYFHVFVNFMVGYVIRINLLNSTVAFLIIGITIPIVISNIIRKIPITRKVLIGL